LTNNAIPTYLDSGARAMLASARAAAQGSRLLEHSFVHEGPHLFWFTWTSSRIERTLAGLGRLAGQLSIRDEEIALVFEKTTEGQVREVYARVLQSPPNLESLAEHFTDRAQEKYEPFLCEALQARSFARDRLDLAGAIGLIRGIL